MRNNDDQISAAADSTNRYFKGNRYGDSFIKIKTTKYNRQGMIPPHPVVVRALLQIIEEDDAAHKYG